MFEETIADLKQNKARSKTVFTKDRRRLLVLTQENITIEKKMKNVSSWKC